MKGRILLSVLALAVISCVRPFSREYFVLRENAEYGDTYSFILDLSDSSATYGLDFFTRLERDGFKALPQEDIVLDLRWFSPSDSILTGSASVRVTDASKGSYLKKDIVSEYSRGLDLPEVGQWRLKARILNDSETIRGLGVILKRN